MALTHHLDKDSLKIPTGPPGKVRTIELMLEHIADVEWWYLHNLRLLEGVRPPSSYERNGFDYLSKIRDAISDRLKHASTEELERVVTTSVQEQWTLRKVLRRLVWHERYHTAAIESGLRQGDV